MSAARVLGRAADLKVLNWAPQLRLRTVKSISSTAISLFADFLLPKFA